MLSPLQLTVLQPNAAIGTLHWRKYGLSETVHMATAKSALRAVPAENMHHRAPLDDLGRAEHACYRQSLPDWTKRVEPRSHGTLLSADHYKSHYQFVFCRQNWKHRTGNQANRECYRFPNFNYSLVKEPGYSGA